MTASLKNCTFFILIETMSSRSPSDNVAVKLRKRKIVVWASGDLLLDRLPICINPGLKKNHPVYRSEFMNFGKLSKITKNSIPKMQDPTEKTISSVSTFQTSIFDTENSQNWPTARCHVKKQYFKCAILDQNWIFLIIKILRWVIFWVIITKNGKFTWNKQFRNLCWL